MKKFITMVQLALVGAFFILNASAAQADELISISHKYIKTDLVDAKKIITVEVTIKNNGTSDLSNISLLQKAPLAVETPQKLLIDSITAGSEVIKLWQITTTLLHSQIPSMLKGLMLLEVEVTDSSNNTSTIEISSTPKGA